MRRGSIIGVLLLVSWALTGVTMAQSPTGSEPGAAEGQKPLTPEEYARVLAKVLPNEGYTLPIAWADLGPKLVRHGVIDLGKLRQLYGKDERTQPDLRRLEAPSEDLITITRDNAVEVIRRDRAVLYVGGPDHHHQRQCLVPGERVLGGGAGQ